MQRSRFREHTAATYEILELKEVVQTAEPIGFWLRLNRPRVFVMYHLVFFVRGEACKCRRCAWYSRIADTDNYTGGSDATDLDSESGPARSSSVT